MQDRTWTKKGIARVLAQALILGASLQQTGCISGEVIVGAATNSITGFLNTLLTTAVSSAVNSAFGG